MCVVCVCLWNVCLCGMCSCGGMHDCLFGVSLSILLISDADLPCPIIYYIMDREVILYCCSQIWLPYSVLHSLLL